MYVAVLQLRDTLAFGNLYLFTAFVGLTWLLWAWKAVLSSRYRPWTTPHEAAVTVVVPVVDEPLDLFAEVLTRIYAQCGPDDEIIVIINGPRNPGLERLCHEQPGVLWDWTPTPGKRNAVHMGVVAASGEIIVLVDSDTVWTEGTLPELLKPFADPRVGGVTTKQRILGAERSIKTRWADWMESLRVEYSMPAMSVLGVVGCLPGRTIAFRRTVLDRAMEHFLHARFLGIFMEVSDDRTLTNEALRQGYRTVYQSTSLVYTDAPTTWRKLARQQFRWSKGSQYNTLRMLPWMLGHSRTLAAFYLADIVLPWMLLGTVTGWIYRWWSGSPVNLYEGVLFQQGTVRGVASITLWSVVAVLCSAGIRQARHLRHQPADFLRFPFYLLLATFLLMPIRLLGFVRMGHQAAWGTRAGAYTQTRTRRWNPLAAVPYLLGVLLAAGGTFFHALRF